jgi:hypothetical protein
MPTPTGDRIQLTTLQRRIIIAVAVGAAAIATIGFVGSYAAVRALAEAKGFGAFARAFPIGVDAGILVLLALDLLLTWLRMPLAMLRHTAWLLTASTVVFNAAASWPDPVGTGMHAVIPVLFVVIVEAARHAIGRTADLTAGRHMESVRVSRWLLDPIATFRLWRRMKLWELRSYDEVIELEQQRLIERARLRTRYGRRWRSKAPVEAVLALRLTRYGRSVADPIKGVLDIEHAPAIAPRAAAALPAAAAPSSSKVPSVAVAASGCVEETRTDARDDFDTAAAAAIAVVQPLPVTAQPDTDDDRAAEQPQPQPPEEEAQPDALVLDLATQPPAPRSRSRAVAKPTAPRRQVVNLRLPEADEPFLDQARKLNVQSLREDSRKVSQRQLAKALGVGQRRAQRLWNALPDTLAAAVAETQPEAKED